MGRKYVDYSYDEFGDKVSMTTYRDINAAGDVTRWLRDEATGLVTNKVYADGKGPRYDYTPDGKLATEATGSATVAGVYDILFGMRRCRISLPNRCYHLISRVAHRAFEWGKR